MLQTPSNITQLTVMNTTPYLRNKVSPNVSQVQPPMSNKMHKQTDNELTELTPELYEQVLEYYRHKNEYFPD